MTRENNARRREEISAGRWEEVTNLLRVKTGQREECLPNANAPVFAQYMLMQKPFYRHCDVCLDIKTLSVDSRECKSCNKITNKDGTFWGHRYILWELHLGGKSLSTLGAIILRIDHMPRIAILKRALI